MMNILSLKMDFKRLNILYTVFLIGYFGFITYLAIEVNLWVDEVFTLNTTERSFRDVFHQAYAFEGQPPFYFLLIHLWRLFSSKIIFAKLFSIFLIALSAFSLNRLLKLVKIDRDRKWITVIFLMNPFTIWAALELRTYSLLILLSILCFYFYLSYIFLRKNKYLYTFLFISIIGIYTQYFFTFLLISIAISHLISFGWKKFITFCLYLLPVAILASPNIPFVTEQLSVIRPRNGDFNGIQMAFKVLRTPQNFLLGLQFLPEADWIRWIVKFIFVSGFLYTYLKVFQFRQVHLNIFNTTKTAIIILFFIITFFLIAVIISKILYMDKYLAISFPFFILLFSAFELLPKRISRAICMLIVVWYAILQVPFFKDPVKGFDYKSIGKYILKIERKNEPLLFYNNSLALTFEYYYSGSNRIYPLPHAVKFDTTFMHSLRTTEDLKESINRIIPVPKSYLLVSDISATPYFPELSRKKLDSFLSRNYQISLDTLYYGKSKEFPLRIRRLEKLH